MLSPPPRNFRAELLDLDEAPFEEVKDSLNDVRRVNRYLSGYRVLLHHITPFLENHTESRPLSILDAATGSADQPIAVIRMARRLGKPVSITALDINEKMLKYSREAGARFPELDFVQGDALSLPFADASFDVVINSLSLHHFSEENAVTMLKGFSRVAKRGVIINDLHRSRVAWAAIYLLTRLMTQNRLTRYDAPVSVMNAFLPSEMRSLAERAGWEQFEIHRHFPYRLALVETKAEGN